MNDINARLQISELLIKKYPDIVKELESELDEKFLIYWHQYEILEIPRKIEIKKSDIAKLMSTIKEIAEENEKLMGEWLTKYQLLQNQIVGFEDDLPKYKLSIGVKTNAEIMKIIKKNKPNTISSIEIEKEVSHG